MHKEEGPKLPQLNPGERAIENRDEGRGFVSVDVLDEREETKEIYIKSLEPEGELITYINFAAITKLGDEEAILEMMGVKISPSIMDLINDDEKRDRYYVGFFKGKKPKFLNVDEKKGKGN